MTNNSTTNCSVIPFKFGAQEVRTILVDDQPWFVANDVSAALEYSEASAMTRHLDDDEKGLSIVQTLGGEQEMLVINESGLYSAILRSRKAEAKRFKKWVTSEVLPAIRKHGRYEDLNGKMATLIGQTIGTDGFHMLASVVKGKVAGLPKSTQRRAVAKIWSQTHAAFGVRSAADIPAEQLDSARNFIAAYAVLEGEYLPRKQKAGRLNIHHPLEALVCRREDMFEDRGNGTAWLDVELKDLINSFSSPCELTLSELTSAGYDVQAAWWEIRTYRNKLETLMAIIRGLGSVASDPQRYAVKLEDAA